MYMRKNPIKQIIIDLRPTPQQNKKNYTFRMFLLRDFADLIENIIVEYIVRIPIEFDKVIQRVKKPP